MEISKGLCLVVQEEQPAAHYQQDKGVGDEIPGCQGTLRTVPIRGEGVEVVQR